MKKRKKRKTKKKQRICLEIEDIERKIKNCYKKAIYRSGGSDRDGGNGKGLPGTSGGVSSINLCV